MKLIITIMTVLAFSSLAGQSYMVNGEDFDYPCSTLYRVTAKSGVNVRSTPNATGNLVCKVPRNQLVTVCSASASDIVEIEGVKARWMEIRYRGNTGFVFGGFLHKEATYDLVLSQDIFYERSEYWIAEYNAVVEDSGKFSMIRVDIKDYLDQQVVSHDKLAEQNILFLFSGSHPFGGVSGVSSDVNLRPGEFMQVGQNSTLYATGDIVSSGTECRVKNYTLHHKYSSSGETYYKKLYSLPEDLIVHGIEALPTFNVEFAGDLDGDREIDVVMWIEVEDTDVTLLLLSGNAEPGFAVRQCVYQKNMWD